MFLKKDYFHLFSSNIEIYKFEYENEEDLKLGVIKLLAILKKNKIIVQVFSKEKINVVLKTYDKSECFNWGNFNFYILEDFGFLENINLSRVRFMNIYSFEKEYFKQNDFNRVMTKSSFTIGFDNYLEVANLKIDFNQYVKDIIKDFIA